MAAALRFAASKLCGRVLEQHHGIFTAAASEGQLRLLLPSISHGGSSLRRFSSSESPNLVNNQQQLPKSVANAGAENNLAMEVEEKKIELLHLLRKMNHPYGEKAEQNKELLRLLGRPPASSSSSERDAYILIGGAFVLGYGIYKLRMNYIFHRD